MEIEIHLENDHSPWERTEIDDQICWLRGDLFDNDELIHGPEILSLISSLSLSSNDDNDALKHLLLRFNGSFAFVIRTSEGLLCTVDRLRSIPIFYGKTDSCLIISDDAQYLRYRIAATFDEENGAEFLLTGFVTGSATLFKEIFQLQAGEALTLTTKNGLMSTFFYHRYWHEKYFSVSEEELLNRLDMVFLQVFRRLIASIKEHDLQIVVPLSGGLDSRIIVSMLKRCGVENVICFSYGRKRSRQARISKQVAEALGYQWYFVEYSKRTCAGINSEEIRRYQNFAGNLVSVPHLQDFFAVKKLKEDQKIPKNAIFIPGHSGDMLAGSHIPGDCARSDCSDANFLEHIIKTHYRHWNWNDETELGERIKEKIERTTETVQIQDNESYANGVECFDFGQRQAKFIVNSVRVYEFFGFSWRIPLWDNDLIDFFNRVPLKYRRNTYLYRKYAVEKLFVDSIRGLGRIDCTTSLPGNPRLKSLTNKISGLFWNKVNFFNSNSFNIESAVIWVFTEQNPGHFKIKNRLFGYKPELCCDSKIIREIISHSRDVRSVPSINGLGTNAYLTYIVGENATSFE